VGAVVISGGHICVDLKNVEMTGDQQRELLRAVEQTVVEQLARIAAGAKVVTITMGQNNGAGMINP
jgi:hypothetical protein